MIGAIPLALLASEFECHQLSYADVTDHGWARLTNASLHTGTFFTCPMPSPMLTSEVRIHG